jgi:hypothetical protein
MIAKWTNVSSAPGQAPGPERAGAVGWLDCGERPAADMLAEVEKLAAALGGELATLERTPGHIVVGAKLPAASVENFKGALALAGASLAPAAQEGADVLVFILSNGRSLSRGEGEKA